VTQSEAQKIYPGVLSRPCGSLAETHAANPPFLNGDFHRTAFFIEETDPSPFAGGWECAFESHSSLLQVASFSFLKTFPPSTGGTPHLFPARTFFGEVLDERRGPERERLRTLDVTEISSRETFPLFLPPRKPPVPPRRKITSSWQDQKVLLSLPLKLPLATPSISKSNPYFLPPKLKPPSFTHPTSTRTSTFFPTKEPVLPLPPPLRVRPFSLGTLAIFKRSRSLLRMDGATSSLYFPRPLHFERPKREVNQAFFSNAAYAHRLRLQQAS